eukprot:gnl/MRDRNA2_/MRDRNA2_116040_c0_seq1.p2 gnl/MRDRNA2_/MRDRNA2_116040_c0~~gnl/MRDRNA2_/MRDRNA2_116040_c0_seq1.p2  ORF type:complete len:128 (-),score=25.28 gnl/MRDRNA2_/MRDRNA2_116040_c0_seq1:52-435(-)
MPRNTRYPASPVQEIVFPEPAPFVQYDKEKSAPTKPEAAVFNEKECLNLKTRLETMGSSPSAALEEAEKCVMRCGWHFTKSSDPAWTSLRAKLGESGTSFDKLAEKDSRLDGLKYAPPSSTWSKWGF